jgi:hypothetical protein
MSFSSIVLSCIGQSLAIVQAGLSRSFSVRVVASLALRKFAVFKFSASRYNKVNQYAPVGAGRGKPRRCLNRYSTSSPAH